MKIMDVFLKLPKCSSPLLFSFTSQAGHLLLCSFHWGFFLSHMPQPGIELTSVELHQTETFEGRPTNLATATAASSTFKMRAKFFFQSNVEFNSEREIPLPESLPPVADAVPEPIGSGSNPGSFQSRSMESLEDWICSSCSTPNFSFRQVCKVCNLQKPENRPKPSQEVLSPEKVSLILLKTDSMELIV